MLLPYASRWASSILPDLGGAALNTSILLSHQMQESARLETATVEDEGVLNASTSAMFLGTVLTEFLEAIENDRLPDLRYFEGLSCNGGCIGGPACLTHELRAPADVDKYGKLSLETSIQGAVDSIMADPKIASTKE